MTGVLQAVAAEREALLAPIAGRLAVLDEIERLAGTLTAPPTAPAAAPAPPPRPKVRPKPAARQPHASPPIRVGRDGLGPKASAILEVVRSSDRWMSRADIVAATGLFSSKVLSTLVERALIEAQGETSQRRYRAVRVDNAAGGGREETPAVKPTAPPPAPAATGALAAEPARILRARILDHLSRRKLSEHSLADHLNAEREHVADILVELLHGGEVEALPGGRYQVPIAA